MTTDDGYTHCDACGRDKAFSPNPCLDCQDAAHKRGELSFVDFVDHDTADKHTRHPAQYSHLVYSL